MQAMGNPTPEVGRRTAGPEKTRLMDLLHANRQPSPAAPAPGSGHAVEEISGESAEYWPNPDGDCASSHSPSEVLGTNTARPLEPPPLSGSDLPDDCDSQEAQPARPGRELSLPTLELAHADTPDHFSASDWPKQDGQVYRTAPGTPSGPTVGDEIPVLEAPGLGQGDSMAVAGGDETRRIATAPADTPGQHHLEFVGHAGQTAFIAPKPPGHGLEGTGWARDRTKDNRRERAPSDTSLTGSKCPSQML